MPTGYTADVQDGTVSDFKTFAMNCARAFGALVTMRDDPADAEIPAEFKADTTYHNGSIATAKLRLDTLSKMTPEEIESARDAAHHHEVSCVLDSNEKALIARNRYLDMLEQVLAWKPPSPDHEGIKTFMEEQLNSSIKFDIHLRDMPVKPTSEDWLSTEIEKADWSLNYHLEQRDAEIERAAGRTKWVQQLRESLT